MSIILSIVLIGCVINDEPVQPNLPQTPIVVVQPSVVVSGKGARLTATLNPNNLATECYFEYGLTTAYGTKLQVKSIHPTAGDVVVGDTISNLVGDSTYHCRLVAWNSSGSTQSVDRAFVAASLPQTPPILVVQPSVVVSGNQAWVKATLNPNNLATECYFEYGLTTAYGTKLQVKSIHPTAGDVVVGDTISFLVRDSTYHCRLVAWNSSGSTKSDDRSFMAASGPPVVMAKVTYLGDEGKLIGTVTPNGRKTTCYIEYGPTTAYGSQLPATLIGVGFDPVTYADTIVAPMAGATMHYRIVAVNENGRGESDDKELKGFVFPLATGTTWNYTYNWFQSAPGVWLNVRTRGSQTWRSGGAETANATTMLLTRVDTTLTWNVLISPETTTVITQIDTSFLVVTTSHSIIIHWYEFSHLAANDGGYLSIPRAYEAKSDTLTRENQNIKAVFVNGKGLISWQYYISAHTPWREVLTLESMYP